MTRLAVGALLALWALAGCDGESAGGADATDGIVDGVDGTFDATDGMRDTGGIDDRGGVDGMADADARLDGSDSAPLDAGAIDVGAIDAGPIDDCASACARYAACDRLALVGGEAACLDRCARAGDAAADWLSCLDAEAECGLIRLCTPPTPPPLDCGAICDALAGCGADAFADCRAECVARAAEGPAFATCGEALAVGCDLDGWWGCLGDTVYRDCGQACRFEAACAGEGDPACAAACITELAVPDPLRRLRLGRRARCVALSGGDCDRVARCDAPPLPPVVDRGPFCQRWDACLGRVGLDCADAYAREEGRAGFVPCADELLAEGCPDDPFEVLGRCFAAVGPRRADCAELCEARALCGSLPDGLDEHTCFVRCDEALAAGGEDEAALLDCGLADDCPALAGCLRARAPATGCADHCAALAGCGVAPDGCEAACADSFHHARDVDHRACVAGALDCDGVRACDPGSPEGCAARCDRYATCEAECPRLQPCEIAPDDCLRRCDDEAWLAPGVAAARHACVAAAPLCRRGRGAVADCRFDPGAAGAACLGWCRARGGCVDRLDAALVECVEGCGAGLGGDDAARFAGARGCLEAAGDDCAAAVACVEAPPPACAPWCAARTACGLDAPADCARCDDDPLSRLRAAEQGACVAAADDCAAVAACDRATQVVDAAALCERWRGCGFEGLLGCDALLDRRPAGFVECLHAALAVCPAEPFDAINACHVRPEVPARVACEASCATRAACDDLDGSARGCVAACVAAVEADPRGREARLLDCGGAVDCGGYRACAEPLDPARACPADCAARAACGAVDADCEARCAAGFYRARQVAARRCVAGAADCEAIAACDLGEPHACDTLCGRYARCGLEPPECERACDDELFEDDATATRRLACGLSAMRCAGDAASVRTCQLDPAAAGAACLGWCRLEAGCPEALDAPLADCLVRCGEGLVGDDGARFAAAAGCLAAEVTGACDALAACVPAAVDCGAWCAARAGCGAAVDDCEAVCAADPLARLRAATEGGCLDDGCAAPCPLPDAAIDLCRLRCEADARCGALDGSIRDCAVDCAGALGRDTFGVEAALVECGRAASCAERAACVARDGPVGRCAGLCAVAVGCGAFDDVEGCVALCAERLRDPWAPPSWIDDAAACLAALDAGACAAEGVECFALGVDPCAASCAALDGCGIASPNCLESCRAQPDRALWIDCVRASIVPPDRCDVASLVDCFVE